MQASQLIRVLQLKRLSLTLSVDNRTNRFEFHLNCLIRHSPIISLIVFSVMSEAMSATSSTVITTPEVDTKLFRDCILQSENKLKGVPRSGVYQLNRYKADLRRALKVAADWGIIDPLSVVGFLGLSKKQLPLLRVLSTYFMREVAKSDAQVKAIWQNMLPLTLPERSNNWVELLSWMSKESVMVLARDPRFTLTFTVKLPLAPSVSTTPTTSTPSGGSGTPTATTSSSSSSSSASSATATTSSGDADYRTQLAALTKAVSDATVTVIEEAQHRKCDCVGDCRAEADGVH